MPTKLLLSPSETALAGVLGEAAITSSLPEEHGADILLYSKRGLVGFQRKSIPNDFITSFTDGRMSRSMSLLTQTCTFTRLICEGVFRYWPDGTVHLGTMKHNKRVPSRFTRKHIHGMLNDIEFVRGVMIRWTDDIADTVRYIRSVAEYLEGKKHLGLYTRPSAKGNWGAPTAKDTELWLLQSFPGIGPSIADSIVSKFGGRVPLAWTCSLDDLVSIPRLSKERAKVMWESLPNTGAVSVSAVGMTSKIDHLREMIGSSK